MRLRFYQFFVYLGLACALISCGGGGSSSSSTTSTATPTTTSNPATSNTSIPGVSTDVTCNGACVTVSADADPNAQ